MKSLNPTTSILSVIILFISLLYACEQSKELKQKVNNQENKLFTLISSETTNIHFKNLIKETLHFNFINYPYIYNGGGVSAGDINNDGLIDLYFTANQGTNKLYLNQGNFQFKDITNSAGVEDEFGWTTGTTMVDINGDGYLDIYVSKSASMNEDNLRKNLLYINQRNNTFKEKGEAYGLNDSRYGSQAYFFDYDNDGDLDMYQLNHPSFENENAILDLSNPSKITPENSDHFYRNEGDGFRNITVASGLANFAYGLSASIGDFNNDGWEDIYVCNDFLQPDYLYINNQDGTFTNKILTQLDHISQNSMGSDLADINNDGFMDLIVMEMSPEDHVRSKSNMPSMSTREFEDLIAIGFHYQYMVNTLQLNEGNGYYSDIAQLAGVSKTDWSWSPLIADFDEDGWNDLFITNGILKDLSNSDFRKTIKSRISNKQKMSLEEAQGLIPSKQLSNYIYQNKGDLTFENKAKQWGIEKLSFSNGSAYADLDNDGDLDLIVNNAADPAHIYRNNSTNNSINVKLLGAQKNTHGIGAKVTIYSQETEQTKYQYLTRGYLSSVTDVLHFGLGNISTVDSIKVVWKDGKKSIINNPEKEKMIIINYDNHKEEQTNKIIKNTALTRLDSKKLGINFKHKDSAYNDFKDQLLLPYKLSQQGPFITASDVNGDGLDDFYIGGAAGQSGRLYIQTNIGFLLREGAWSLHKSQEDIQSIFFDFDNDGDMDLYVVSGSYEFVNGSPLLQDRLYRNDGNGDFSVTKGIIPSIKSSGSTVQISDIDNDGDQDIFVGSRVIPNKYPLSPISYLLENINGRFVDNTSKIAPQLSEIGMVTDAVFSDFDSDGDEDLIVVGEWSSIQIFENSSGKFQKIIIPDLESTVGLWFSIEANDIDNDGDEDYFIGNLGLNSKFKVGKGKEFHVYAEDFDNNGVLDIVLTNKYQDKLVPARGLECSSEQIPNISKDFTSFQSFALASMDDIYGKENLMDAFHIQADILYSIFLKNNGNGDFEIIKLPNKVQVSPIIDFEFIDIDKDGVLEIITVGNLYETEVETVRYDASKGSVITFKNNEFKLADLEESGFFIKGNMRDIQVIKSLNKQYILVTNNDDTVSVFSF